VTVYTFTPASSSWSSGGTAPDGTRYIQGDGWVVEADGGSIIYPGDPRGDLVTQIQRHTGGTILPAGTAPTGDGESS
jgi:hypothetical protein